MASVSPTSWFDIKEEQPTLSDSNGKSSNNSGGTNILDEDIYCSSSVAEDISDQMAVAVLRLQTNMEQVTKRLDLVEGQIKSLNKASSTSKKSNNNNNFNSLTTMKIFMITWPVIVYFAFRAIEKRRSSSS